MSLKKLVSALFIGSALTACQKTPESPADPELEAVKHEVKAHQGTPKDLLHRLELYSLHTPSSNLFTYSRSDDGQFVTVVTDSADIRTENFMDFPAGHAFVMDALSTKEKTGYALDTVYLAEHHIGETVNIHSIRVELKHESAKPGLKRKNDTETNLKELKNYSKYGSVFTLATPLVGVDKDGHNQIPAFAEFDSPMGMARVETQSAMDVLGFYKAHKIELVRIERVERDVNDTAYDYVGYAVYLRSAEKPKNN